MVLRHAVQRAGFDFFLKFDSFEGRIVAGEPVAEACAREVPVENKTATRCCGPTPVMMTSASMTSWTLWARLQWRQWVAWPRATADRVDGCLVPEREVFRPRTS